MTVNETSGLRLSRLAWCWLGGLVCIALIGFIIGQFDDFTELAPDHSDSVVAGGTIGALVALGSSAVIFCQSSGVLARRLLISLLVTPLFAMIGFFILVNEGSTLYFGWRDFPAETTRTFTGLMAVRRAYHTHGKNQSWHVQTEPVWADFDIIPEDYNFMIEHRPSDSGNDPDEIKSKGLFCIRVVAQQAGQAVRVLNAGTHALPQGSVGLCSTLLATSPSIVRIV